MSMWAKGKGNTFLTREDGINWLKTLKQDLETNLNLSYKTLKIKNKIENDAVFFESKIVRALKDDLNLENTEKQIFNIVSEHSELTLIKVCQVLDLIKNYDIGFQDNYCFFPLNSALRNLRELIQDYKDRKYFLILECTTEDDQLQIETLASALLQIIQQNDKKKIILISKQGDLFAKIFKDAIEGKYQENVDDSNNNFTDLENGSQTKLLQNSVVVFQGQEINLGKLISTDQQNLLDRYTLSLLVKGETVEIGKPLLDLSDVENYFIKRTFHRDIRIKKIIEEEGDFVFIKCYKDITSMNLLQSQDIIITSNEKKQFEMLCKNYEQYNIHWVRIKNNEFIWRQTFNSLFKLRKFCYESKSISKIGMEDLNDQIVIISGEPGIGKTTILTNAAKQLKNMDNTNWIARINFLECVESFSKWRHGKAEEQTLQLMFKHILKKN